MTERKQTIAGQILGSLLESSKTTAQLAKELGYVDLQGNPRYNVINRDLQNLVTAGYITGEKKKVNKLGSTPTLYSIVFDNSVLINMLDNYPYLVTQMQKNTLVIDRIIREFSYYISDFRVMSKLSKSNGWKDEENDNDIGEFEYFRNLILDPCFQAEYILCDESNKYVTYTRRPVTKKSYDFGDDLTQKLQLSPEFFKLFLTNDKQDLLNYIVENIEISDNYIYSNSPIVYKWDKLEGFPATQFLIFGISLLFRTCVSMDIFHKQSNTAAKEYVKQMIKQTQNEIIKQQ